MNSLEKKKNTLTSFDYQNLDNDQKLIIIERTKEIKECLRRSARDIWEIGKKLVEVRSQLRHGQFETWLKTEFGWSRRTAYNFINVYETFNERANLAKIDISTSALYLLAAPSTPEKVREKVLQRAQQGEIIKHKELSEIIQQEKKTSTQTVKQQKSAPKPTSQLEIVTIISKNVDEEGKTAINDTTPANATVNEQITPNQINPGWYLLEKQHLLFYGDTASANFREGIPFDSFAIAITNDDWDHDWLIDKIKTVIVFPESKLQEETIEQLIKLCSAPGETIVYPWIPDPKMLSIAHKLERKIYAGDIDPKKCYNALTSQKWLIERVN